jgi:hypothetical protein
MIRLFLLRRSVLKMLINKPLTPVEVSPQIRTDFGQLVSLAH